MLWSLMCNKLQSYSRIPRITLSVPTRSFKDRSGIFQSGILDSDIVQMGKQITADSDKYGTYQTTALYTHTHTHTHTHRGT